MSQDILAELDALIGRSMEQNPPAKPDLPPPPPIRTVPKAGTTIQRSDQQTQAKWQALTTPPPPPPGKKPTTAVCAIRTVATPPATKRRRGKFTIRPAPTSLVPAPPTLPPTTFGPELPPPILVEYAPGKTTAVPYFAATKARLYRLRTDEGRWKLRFSKEGMLTSSTKLPDAHAPLP